MITAIIETKDHEVALAHALAALVPAATEGVVRDVVVIDYGSTDGTLVVADTAGCTIVDGRATDGDPRHRAAANARGDWLLFLSPSVILASDWQVDALSFVDRAMVTGRGRSAVGRFHRGRLADGWGARVAEWWAWLVAAPRPDHGVLISKTAWLALGAPSAPAPSGASSVSGARRGAA